MAKCQEWKGEMQGLREPLKDAQHAVPLASLPKSIPTNSQAFPEATLPLSPRFPPSLPPTEPMAPRALPTCLPAYAEPIHPWPQSVAYLGPLHLPRLTLCPIHCPKPPPVQLSSTRWCHWSGGGKRSGLRNVAKEEKNVVN